MCLTAPVVQAQQHSFFTHYSTEDGLSQNTVMSMLQDHKDNLWFATWDGINRFDGYNFKTYKARQGNYISLTNNRASRGFPFGMTPGVKGSVLLPILISLLGRNSILTAR